ncbi:hypothetical protein BBJ28_00027047 [Nothophytophthora sp. Chile5]|nr:hypothetical protein BBJ28_00027047 [Nothophytophthora sp. Chile5]
MTTRGLPDLHEFKGRYGAMLLSSWLTQVSHAIRRSERMFKRTWPPTDLYLTVSTKLQGDAADWFLRWSRNVHPHEETLEHLTQFLQTKYGDHSELDDAMNRIRERRQMPGERLSDFASALLELAGDKHVRDGWFVSSFLNGMDNQIMAQFVKAQQPQDLMAATQIAIQQGGEFGEGSRVGWEEARVRHSQSTGLRRTLGDGQRSAATAATGQQLTTPVEAARQMATTFAAAGGSGDKPPRYDADGRLVLATEARMVPAMCLPAPPPGYMWSTQTAAQGEILPTAAAAPAMKPEPAATPMGTAMTTTAGVQTVALTQQPVFYGQQQVPFAPQLVPLPQQLVPVQQQQVLLAQQQIPAQPQGFQGQQQQSQFNLPRQGGAKQRRSRAFQTSGGGNTQQTGGREEDTGRYGPPEWQAGPLNSKAERLENQRRYHERRQRRAGGGQGSNIVCYYCRHEGHMSRDCPLRREDQGLPAVGGSGQEMSTQGQASGNGPRT